MDSFSILGTTRCHHDPMPLQGRIQDFLKRGVQIIEPPKKRKWREGMSPSQPTKDLGASKAR